MNFYRVSDHSKWSIRVAAGILRAVEGGILPPGPGVDLPDDWSAREWGNPRLAGIFARLR